jgi:anaerobic selenocysteine-containing dehydrogenase
MFSFIRLSDGGPARYAGPRSEVSVLTTLGQRVLGESSPVDWAKLESHDAIRQLIAEMIPGLEPMATIARTKQEFHIPGRALNTRTFPTPGGKARFHAVPLPELPPSGEREFRLMTIRSEGQFNTVVYEEEDLYRGQDRRDVVLMHPYDLTRLDLKPDQLVRVKSAHGELRYQHARPFDVRAGNVMMYCPEANVLLSRAVDPESKTPAFKNVLVSVEAEAPLQASVDHSPEVALAR